MTAAPLTARKLAAAEHRRTYENGVPCPQGHVGPRYTVNGSCVECQRAWTAANRRSVRKQVGGS